MAKVPGSSPGGPTLYEVVPIASFGKRLPLFSLLAVLALLFIAYVTLEPFLLTIAGAAIVAYLFFPVYRWIRKSVPSRGAGAFLMLLLILIIVLIPFALLFLQLQPHVATFLAYAQEGLASLPVNCTAQGSGLHRTLCSLSARIAADTRLQQYALGAVNQLGSGLYGLGRGILFSAPSFLLQLTVFLFVLYYAFKDGEALADTIRRRFPLSKAKRKRFFSQFEQLLAGVVYGNILIALVQAVLATVGYLIVGTVAPFIFGIITFFFVFVPAIGAAAVWLPIALYYLLAGAYLKGLFMLAYGIIVVSSMDNLIRPYLLSGKTRMHPLLMLLGVVGGVAAFGFIGVFLGPIILGTVLIVFSMLEPFRERIS